MDVQSRDVWCVEDKLEELKTLLRQDVLGIHERSSLIDRSATNFSPAVIAIAIAIAIAISNGWSRKWTRTGRVWIIIVIDGARWITPTIGEIRL